MFLSQIERMQYARDRITLGLAIAVAVVSAMADSWLVATPLLLLAIFLIVWGRSPAATEAVISSLPMGSKLLLLFAYLDRTISPREEPVGDNERRRHLKKYWSRMGDTEKRGLASTLAHGSPRGVSRGDWYKLTKTELG